MPPLPALPASLTHSPPCTSWPPLNDQFSAASLAQDQSTTLAPLAELPPRSSTHLPSYPLITCTVGGRQRGRGRVMETWMLPLPLRSAPAAVTSHESGWANGSLSVRVVGVVAVKLPLDPAARDTYRASYRPVRDRPVWSGLAVMVTVMMSGLFAVPLAAQSRELALASCMSRCAGARHCGGYRHAARTPRARRPARPPRAAEAFSSSFPLYYPVFAKYIMHIPVILRKWNGDTPDLVRSSWRRCPDRTGLCGWAGTGEFTDSRRGGAGARLSLVAVVSRRSHECPPAI